MKSLSRVRLFATPMDYSLPGYSIHWIFQARVLEWGAISFSRGSSRPRDRTRVSRIVGRRFYCLSHQGSQHLIIALNTFINENIHPDFLESKLDACFSGDSLTLGGLPPSVLGDLGFKLILGDSWLSY